LPPLTDIDGALAEIARAYDQLAADGVRVMSVYQDLWLGDPTFDPIWAELDRRDAVVFVHPDQPCGCATMPSYAAIELPFDTARTVESLWRFDVSRRFPRIKFILSHGGGALPMIAGRLIDRIELPHEASVSTASEGIGYFRRFYFDTANAATPPALNATLALAASDRVLFGSDYPFVSVGRQIEHLRNSGLPTHELHAILGGNAGKLIPRLCGHHNN
jgi:aminocarboxymuconate-semialdehyde decarboxylase